MQMTGSISRGRTAEKHNTRECYRDLEHTPENIDRSRSAENVVLVNRPIEEVYRERFGAATEEYNARQVEKGHPERQIPDYLEKVRADKKLQPMYEFVVQVGNMEEHPDAGTAAEIYGGWLDGFRERFGGQFAVKQAIVHMDEATPHMHVEVVPCAESGRGLSVQNSMNKAVKQSGFPDYKAMLAGWDEVLAECMSAHGIERVAGDRERQMGGVDIDTYKRTQAAVREAKQRSMELNNEIADKQGDLVELDSAIEDRELELRDAESRRVELMDEVACKKLELYEVSDAVDGKEVELEKVAAKLADEQRRLECLRQAGDRVAGRVEELESIAADVRGFEHASRSGKGEILDRVARACDGLAARVRERLEALSAAVERVTGHLTERRKPESMSMDSRSLRAAAKQAKQYARAYNQSCGFDHTAQRDWNRNR